MNLTNTEIYRHNIELHTLSKPKTQCQVCHNAHTKNRKTTHERCDIVHVHKITGKRQTSAMMKIIHAFNRIQRMSTVLWIRSIRNGSACG